MKANSMTRAEVFGIWGRALMVMAVYAVSWLGFWLHGSVSQAGTIAVLIGLAVGLAQNANRYAEPSAEVVNAFRLMAVPLALCWLILRPDAGWMSLPLCIETIGMALTPFAERIVDGQRVLYTGPVRAEERDEW